MNLFVADPDWGWWITFYFYLGGIAAGAYFTATLIELVGSDSDRELARIGYWIAFPLVGICGVLLILDLYRPERFWHMLLKSEVVHAALDEGWPWSGRSWKTMSQAFLLKYWSPMSIGSWALLLFGLCTSLSFLGSLWPGGRFARWFRHGVFGRVLQVCGSAVGFFAAAYTGALLTATNQPIWSDSIWIASLFLASAASTGIAALILLAPRRKTISEQTVRKLERADLWVVSLELVIFVLFVLSLNEFLRSVFNVRAGRLLLVGTAVLAILVPLAIQFWLRLRRRAGRAGLWQAVAASIFALLGGFLLRYALLTTPPELLANRPTTPQVVGTPDDAGWRFRLSPEDGRRPGEPGADPGNRAGDVRPPSKVLDE